MTYLKMNTKRRLKLPNKTTLVLSFLIFKVYKLGLCEWKYDKQIKLRKTFGKFTDT